MKSLVRMMLMTSLLGPATNLLNAQWVQTPTPSTFSYAECFASIGTNLFAGTYGGGVFLSTNNGASWTAVNTGLTRYYNVYVVLALAVSGTNLFAGTSEGVFLSTNNGTFWTEVNSGLTNTNVSSLAISGTNLFAGTYGGGVFLSTNNGTSWTTVNNGLTNTNVQSLAVSGTNLFVGTFGSGVFLSTNNGTSRTAAGLTSAYVRSLAVSGTNLFVGTSYNGVFLSTNNGNSWTNVNAPPKWVLSLAVNETHLFAGFYKNSVWRRPLSEMITSIQDLSNQIPTKFKLEQNYPNPFNPSTKIQYSVPQSSNVIIKVVDILGNEIETLVNEEKPIGTYELTWNAANLPSGVYFYQLKAGSFVETKKMILVK